MLMAYHLHSFEQLGRCISIFYHQRFQIYLEWVTLFDILEAKLYLYHQHGLAMYGICRFKLLFDSYQLFELKTFDFHLYLLNFFAIILLL